MCFNVSSSLRRIVGLYAAEVNGKIMRTAMPCNDVS
jgi:hypothetical protein